MGNLDLNAYGVSEVTMEEASNTGGGFIQFIAGAFMWVGLSTAWDILNNLDRSAECFHNGYDSVVRDDIYN